jgi:MoxR-like ATPase
MAEILNYSGKALENGYEDEKLNLHLRPYIPSQGLKKAVNLALYLKKRPLLLMGEPGVGKTCLAESVAFELLGADGMKDRYFRWNVKSTTKAKDGLYRYDTFRRLADSQILRTAEERVQLNNLKIDAENSYIQRGDLAQAFHRSTRKKRSVILIDEIDKADIDFPNDLLNELENYDFVIPETGEKVTRDNDFEYPVIIISSNRERELPPAFLRRCLYHYIEFPSDAILGEIIFRVFDKPAESALVQNVLKAFKDKRANSSETEKKPSTSELLDWFSVINYYQRLKDDTKDHNLLTEDQRALIGELDLLGTTQIPFAEVLLKTYEAYTGNQSK